MNHKEIEWANNRIAEEAKELDKLKSERAMLRCGGDQNTVSLYCQSRKLQIIDISRETNWSAKQVRGMEMIALGLIKWYDAEIDRQEAKVAEWKARLNYFAGGAR